MLGPILLGIVLVMTVCWVGAVFVFEDSAPAQLEGLEGGSHSGTMASTTGVDEAVRVEVAAVEPRPEVEPLRLRVVQLEARRRRVVPAAAMRLSLERLLDDFDGAAADFDPSLPLPTFYRTTDANGIADLRGLPGGQYEVRAVDNSRILLGTSVRGEIPKGCVHCIEVDLAALADRGHELVAAHLVAAVALPVADRALTWRTALDNAKWWPRRLEARIATIGATLAHRFTGALAHVGFDCDGVEGAATGSVDFIVLGARSGITRHAIPLRRLDRLEAPTMIDLRPPKQAVSTLMIQAVNARGMPIRTEQLELACLSAGCDLPHFALPCGVPCEVPPGTYYLHCKDAKFRAAFRKEVPDPIKLGVGEQLLRVVQLR